MQWILFAVAGLVVGHLVRRATPYVIAWKDKSLPFTYPWVEILTAVIFALIALQLGTGLAQWKWLVLATILVSITATDQLSKYINDWVCYGGALLGVILTAAFPADVLSMFNHDQIVRLFGFFPELTWFVGLLLGLLGAAVGFVQLYFVRRVFQAMVGIEVMGLGDALLMLMAGAFLGPQAIFFAILPACLIGVVVGYTSKIFTGKEHFPFGPSLGAGVLVILLAGETVIGAAARFHLLIYNLSDTGLIVVSLALVMTLVFLILRLRRRAAEFEEMIEEDYADIDKKIEQ